MPELVKKWREIKERGFLHAFLLYYYTMFFSLNVGHKTDKEINQGEEKESLYYYTLVFL